MISIKILFTILLFHWLADFWIQTDWQAKNKSSNNEALLAHTFTYSLCWFIFCGLFAMTLLHMLLFVLITFVCHTITDYFTSRLNTSLLKKVDTHFFFVSVGGDQILHYVQLILTYYYLTNGN